MQDLETLKMMNLFSVLGLIRDPRKAVETALIVDEARRICKEKNMDRQQIRYLIFEAADNLSLPIPFQEDKILETLFMEMPQTFDWIEIYKKCVRGFDTVVPNTLCEIMAENIGDNPNRLLIAEGIKFLPYLKQIADKFSGSLITITCDFHWQSLLIEKIIPGCVNNFQPYKHVKYDDESFECEMLPQNSYGYVEIIHKIIYRPFEPEKIFDAILSVPAFGGRQYLLDAEALHYGFLSRKYHNVALQNLMWMLKDNGKLSIVLPYGFMFESASGSKVREYIAGEYCVDKIAGLPLGLFAPFTSVHTVLLNIINKRGTESITVDNYVDMNPKEKKIGVQDIILEAEKLVSFKELNIGGTWNIRQFFDSEEILLTRYHSNAEGKAKLEDVTETFRGKNISQKDDDGEYGVINIGNIGDYEMIKWDSLQRVNEDERKMKNYILQEGDLLLPARGSAIRCVVFHEQEFKCIASANIIVVRPDLKILDSLYLKIFFDSPIGKALIASTQQGVGIINVSYKELKSIMIPIPPIKEQKKIAVKYKRELEKYQSTIRSATERWQGTLDELQQF